MMDRNERRAHWQDWAVALVVALSVAVLVVVGMAGVLWAADPDDYDYRIPVSVTNEGASAFAGLVCADMNPAGLAAAGFMATDALDAAGFDTGGAEIDLVRADITSNDACWFVDVDTLAAGTQATLYVYLGGNTATADNPQSVVFLGPSDSVDVPDAASLDITANLTVEAAGVTLRSVSPSAGTYLTGGTVTQLHGWRVHTFTASSTLDVVRGGEVNYLCVAGGGGGGGVDAANWQGSGGGGGGAVATGTLDTAAGLLTITIGAGGAGGSTAGSVGANGATTTIDVLASCTGGGGGGGQLSRNGLTGASGGGANGNDPTGTGTGGAGTAGNNGGDSAIDLAGTGGFGGGGGGAGSAGVNGVTGTAGNGGQGLVLSIPGQDYTLGCGGGGGASTGTAGSGVAGCSGGGALGTNAGSAAPSNRGGGGGGASVTGGSGARAGGTGGSGLVVVWYRPGTCLVCKDGAYSLWVEGATLTGDVTISSTTTTVSVATLVADTEYDLSLTYDSVTLDLLIGGVSVASTGLGGAVAASTSDVLVGGSATAFSVGRVVINSVLDLTFEPVTLVQTQEGSAGNGWTWLVDAADSSASSNDAVWTFVADMASVTIDVLALAPIALPPLVDPATGTPDVVGPLPDLNVTSASTTIDSDFTALISFTGWPLAGMWLLFAIVVSTAVGAAFSHVWEPLGVIMAPTLVGVGGFLGHYGWGYIIVAALLAFGVSGALAVWRSK